MFRIAILLLLALPLSAFQAADSTIFAKLGHSQHGEAFDTGPREKPWPIAGIGVAHFPITTKNPEVQRWFDQGNALLAFLLGLRGRARLPLVPEAGAR